MIDEKNIADLGSVAVLDASHLIPGQHVEIEGQLCKVTRITDDNRVYLEVVRGFWPLFQHYLKKHWAETKWSLLVTALFGLLIYLFSYFHLERFLR